MAFLEDVTRSDLEEFGVSKMMERQCILLALHTLTNELILHNEHVDACAMCQNQTPEETVAYLEECKIGLSKERILKVRASVGHLALMDYATLKNTFSLERIPAMLIQRGLKGLLARHLENLS